jgi:hypothetical protein
MPKHAANAANAANDRHRPLSWHSKTLQILGQVLAFEERDLTKMPPDGGSLMWFAPI